MQRPIDDISQSLQTDFLVETGMKLTRRTFCGLVLAWVMMAPVALGQPAKGATPRIDVILWFDTEDYLLPADDDAA